MGADIHLYAETRQMGGQWKLHEPPRPVGYETHSWEDWQACLWRWRQEDNVEDGLPKENGTVEWRIMRQYNLFAALAGVRGYGPNRRGLPPDVTPEVAMEANYWGQDGHSHSWWTLAELKSMDLPRSDLTEEIIPRLQELGLPHDDVRVVFWFDN